MNKILKYLGQPLQHIYGAMVAKPVPWSMIDKLESLDEKCEPREMLKDDHEQELARQSPESFESGSSPTRRPRDGVS